MGRVVQSAPRSVDEGGPLSAPDGRVSKALCCKRRVLQTYNLVVLRLHPAVKHNPRFDHVKREEWTMDE
jgi:hypothetical protein